MMRRRTAIEGVERNINKRGEKAITTLPTRASESGDGMALLLRCGN